MITMCYPGGRLKALTLSYDDGVRQDRRLISILDKYGIKATFNINSGMLADTSDYEAQKGRMSAEEIKSLFYNSPHELAVHGLEHAFETELSSNLRVYEILEDRKNIEKLSGKIIRGMAYPYGDYDDRLVEVLKQCGICYSRTCENIPNFSLPTDWLRLSGTCHHSNEQLDELADRFLNLKPMNAKLFYLWGHSYEFDWELPNNNWGIIENFAEKMGGRDDIWYATNIEIYDYVKAYESLQFSTEQSLSYNPNAIEVSFIKTDRRTKSETVYTIKPGETLKL